MVGLKVKSYNATKNLENTTFPALVEHQTMSKPKKFMVLNLLCCKILSVYIPCLSISVSKSSHNVVNIFF